LAGTFHWSEDPSTLWLVGTFHHRRSRLLKTGFFKQVMELKIQRKNPGSALHYEGNGAENTKAKSRQCFTL
jgi:hypothetical protein